MRKKIVYARKRKILPLSGIVLFSAKKNIRFSRAVVIMLAAASIISIVILIAYFNSADNVQYGGKMITAFIPAT